MRASFPYDRVVAALETAEGITEAARALGVSAATLKSWCASDERLRGLHEQARRRGYQRGYAKRQRARFRVRPR